MFRTLRTFRTLGRMILTGTPLHNNLLELWSLMNFLIPEIFVDVGVFESWFEMDSLRGGTEQDLELQRKNRVISTIHAVRNRCPLPNYLSHFLLT